MKSLLASSLLFISCSLYATTVTIKEPETTYLQPNQVFVLPNTGNYETARDMYFEEKEKDTIKTLKTLGLMTLIVLNWQTNTAIGTISGCIFLYEVMK